MRYDAQDVSTSRLMELVERTEEKHPEAIRRDLRPHKTVVHTPSQTTDARKGQFTLRVNFRSGEAVFRADRNVRYVCTGDIASVQHVDPTNPIG